jgi:hypothetical protein
MTRKCLSGAQVASARIRNQRAQGNPAPGGAINFNLIALTTQLILADLLDPLVGRANCSDFTTI